MQTRAEPSDIEAPPLRGRRHALYGAVAVLAAATGAGVAWWKFEPGGAQEAAALSDLWRTSFDTPGGGRLAMGPLQGRPLLINFWATWCPPCIEEMPLLDAFYSQNHPKGWQVVGLAIDQPSSVKAFLGRRPVHYPIGMAGMEGTNLSKSLGNASGGLPFSVVIGADSTLVDRKVGRLLPADLANWSRAA